MENTIEEIIEITDSAVTKIQSLIESRGRGQLAVRVLIKGALPGGGYQSEFKFVDSDDLENDDVVQNTGKFALYFDPECAISLKGAVVDFDEQKYTTGFNIAYPSVANDFDGPPERSWSDPLSKSVQKVIDEEINPGILAHLGWVALRDIKDQTAFIEMGGGCQGCGLSDVTLTNGIERLIMGRVPEIKAVIDATNHAEGEHPYYAAANDELESPIAKGNNK